MKFAETIKSKSDQLNAVDLIEYKKIKITGVQVLHANEQPVSIFYDGDNGKPYKPCLSMRRVIATAWGLDDSNFVGKSLQLFNDPSVVWAGEQVGGIRISAMSHIADNGLDVIIALNKKKRVKIHIDKINDAPDFYPDGKFKDSWDKIKGAIINGLSYDDLIIRLEKSGQLTEEQHLIIHATYTDLKGEK